MAPEDKRLTNTAVNLQSIQRTFALTMQHQLYKQKPKLHKKQYPTSQ